VDVVGRETVMSVVTNAKTRSSQACRRGVGRWWGACTDKTRTEELLHQSGVRRRG
jgi:hypothetical protein